MARDQIACTRQAAFECREAVHSTNLGIFQRMSIKHQILELRAESGCAGRAEIRNYQPTSTRL